MLTFLKKLWMQFWFDEMLAAKLVRGFLLWVGGMAVSVLAFPFDDVVTWQWKEWLYRIAAAGALGFAGLISVGQKNPTPDEIRAIAASPPGTPDPTKP